MYGDDEEETAVKLLERRRAINRRAAQKSRKRLKENAVRAKKLYYDAKTFNTQLTYEKRRLERKRSDLFITWQAHQATCSRKLGNVDSSATATAAAPAADDKKVHQYMRSIPVESSDVLQHSKPAVAASSAMIKVGLMRLQELYDTPVTTSSFAADSDSVEFEFYEPHDVIKSSSLASPQSIQSAINDDSSSQNFTVLIPNLGDETQISDISTRQYNSTMPADSLMPLSNMPDDSQLMFPYDNEECNFHIDQATIVSLANRSNSVDADGASSSHVEQDYTELSAIAMNSFVNNEYGEHDTASTSAIPDDLSDSGLNSCIVASAAEDPTSYPNFGEPEAAAKASRHHTAVVRQEKKSASPSPNNSSFIPLHIRDMTCDM